MQRLGRYTIRSTVHTSSHYIVYAAALVKDAQPFLIKTVTKSEQGKDSLAQLQHEYYLLEKLNKLSAFFPKTVEFIDDPVHPGIVFEDEGYRPLLDNVDPGDLSMFLPVAIQLTEAVSVIHNANIIHKHLTPFNVFYHPKTGKIQIYDFSIASELNRTMVPNDPPRLLQGTLEYMAPEQTGRMNRPLTQKADLYSLGIIFYEWLTGNVPFKSKEPMTIVFGHIANTPIAPHAVKKNIPVIVSNIILKLLSKPAEERYKSAPGLAYDLTRAAEGGKAASFPLGSSDLSMRLELPDQLYGRETEIALLYQAFDDLCETHENKLIAVSGYSGIGKTSLVRELTKKIALVKGFFASGKFDKFQQSDAYEGLRSALDKIIRYHLSLPEAEYQQFKQNVIDEMGAILGVITNFVPRLTSIVGQQEPVAEVGFAATKNRFELAIRRFIKIASQHHPLVLFLDDMQWANYSMLDLLQKLVISEDIKNLFVIISYRSNEVAEPHPLLYFFDKVSKRKPVTEIHVEGLSDEALSRLLQDMLYLPAQEVASLAHLMGKKTEGNPFFLLMLLEELYREGEIYFDIKTNRWRWDEKTIVSMAAADNVLDFVARRIERLDPHVRDVLHCAACVGNTFSIKELALAQMGHPGFLVNALQPAMEDGLILPTRLSDEWTQGISDEDLLQREYRFQHDKIQQSCYEVKSVEDSKKVHLQLARNWYEAYKDELSSTRLMMIADQYDKGLSYIADMSEKKRICQLNFDAGEIALQSAAYEIAHQYNKIAKSLLPKNAWEDSYDLTFAIFLNYIKSSFLSHHFVESEQAGEEALEHADSTFDKAYILSIKGDLARTGKKSGIVFYEEALRLLGYPEIAKAPGLFEIAVTLLRYKRYVHRYSEDLSSLPAITPKEQDLILICTGRLGEECYFNGDILRYAYVFAKWSIKTIAHHTVDTRAISIGLYSLIWPRSFFSKQLYIKAANVLSVNKNKEIAASFYVGATALTRLWHYALPESVPYFLKAIETCEEAGNLDQLALGQVYITMFQPNATLPERLSAQKKLEYLVRDTSPRALSLLMIEEEYVEWLLDSEKKSDAEDAFNTRKIIAMCEETNYSIRIFTLYAKKFAAFIHRMEFKPLEQDTEIMYKWLPKINRANAVISMLPGNFYLFLFEIERYPGLSLRDKLNTRVRLRDLYHRVKSWVKFCPENFQPYHLIMKAEYQRLKGHTAKALVIYDEAIRSAAEYNVMECLGLANTRALSLCAATHQEGRARFYAEQAVNAYETWGAFAVVSKLKENYGNFFGFSAVNPSTALTQEQQVKREENARYAMDVRSIVYAADAISKEIHLDGLLCNVMQLLVENLGATKSALCLIQKGELWVEGFYDSGTSTAIQTMGHTHWEEASLPQEVLLTAWREQKEVIVLDVSKDTELNAGEYFSTAGTKCLIASPIIRGSTVVGIIYCENNKSTNAFTPERIDILRALSIQMSIAVENSRLYTLFERFVPKSFLSQLGQEFIFDIEQGDSVEKHMNVLFMDIRNFTEFSEAHSADEAFRFINDYLHAVTPAIHTHHGFIDKFMGDGIMALFPATSDEALLACIDMHRRIAHFAEAYKGKLELKVGMGLHYGPLMLGVVGATQHIEGTVIGDTVNVASRIESLNKLYDSECLISDSIRKRLVQPEEFDLREVGRVTLLGRKEPTAIWQVLKAIQDPATRALFLEDAQIFSDAYQLYLQRQFNPALREFQRIAKRNPHDMAAKFYVEQCRAFLKTPPPAKWSGQIMMGMK